MSYNISINSGTTAATDPALMATGGADLRGITASRVSARDIVIDDCKPRLEPSAKTEFKSNFEGALWWYEFGYKVIPLVPGQKRPAVAHHPWLEDLSPDTIRQHWGRYPGHEVGGILDHNQIVLDADSSEAEEALLRLEKQFGVVPALIIKTRRGHHHHFRLVDGTFAKPDSHGTTEFPGRLDVRAGKNSVVLTPSQDKSICCLEAKHRDGLGEVNQDFVDAVFQHNGRPLPRPVPDEVLTTPSAINADLATLSKLVDRIDPDCGYQDWLAVLMAIYHETAGGDRGLELADSRSKKAKSYTNRADIETKWKSFSGDVAKPITIATLVDRARNAGADVGSIMREEFQPCPTVFIPAPSAKAAKEPATKASPLMKHSLRGQAAKYEALAQAATPLLGQVCYRGEATVWYAKHNTGKTLLTLHLTSEAIEQGRIAAKDVFLINADDSSSGLAEKLGLLDEMGAHTLVPGQGGFKAENLQDLLLQAVHDDTARGTLVVIDTLKKFVDLMHKRQASDFANVCRQFVAAGGTVVGLAHTNKRRSDEGKAIHAGTTDILDDFDAGYIIDEVPLTGNPGERFVEFTRVKARGGGVQFAVYAYAAEDGLSYAERLASVRVVDQAEMAGIKRVEEKRSDAEIISVVAKCITGGVDTKMALRNAVAEQANISRRAATKVIERHTGDDPAQHHWSFARKAHGTMKFSLLSGAADLEGEGATVIG